MLTDEWGKTWMPFSITRRLYFGEYLFILCNVMIFASDSAVLQWRWLFPMLLPLPKVTLPRSSFRCSTLSLCKFTYMRSLGCCTLLIHRRRQLWPIVIKCLFVMLCEREKNEAQHVYSLWFRDDLVIDFGSVHITFMAYVERTTAPHGIRHPWVPLLSVYPYGHF